jgi:hypothetical protein
MGFCDSRQGMSLQILALLGQRRPPRPKRIRWATSLQKTFGQDPLLDSNVQRMYWVRAEPESLYPIGIRGRLPLPVGRVNLSVAASVDTNSGSAIAESPRPRLNQFKVKSHYRSASEIKQSAKHKTEPSPHPPASYVLSKVALLSTAEGFSVRPLSEMKS